MFFSAKYASVPCGDVVLHGELHIAEFDQVTRIDKLVADIGCNDPAGPSNLLRIDVLRNIDASKSVDRSLVAKKMEDFYAPFWQKAKAVRRPQDSPIFIRMEEHRGVFDITVQSYFYPPYPDGFMSFTVVHDMHDGRTFPDNEVSRLIAEGTIGFLRYVKPYVRF